MLANMINPILRIWAKAVPETSWIFWCFLPDEASLSLLCLVEGLGLSVPNKINSHKKKKRVNCISFFLVEKVLVHCSVRARDRWRMSLFFHGYLMCLNTQYLQGKRSQHLGSWRSFLAAYNTLHLQLRSNGWFGIIIQLVCDATRQNQFAVTDRYC